MNYDKLIYRKTTQPGIVLTVDFGGIGELTVASESAGEVTWRRLTTPVRDVLQAKLAACGFDSWQSEDALPVCWGLELFHNGQLAKRICGCNAVPEMIRSLLEFCTALAENRSKRRIAQPTI